MLDSRGVPLFNANAWNKAKGVLREVQLGLAADSPDRVYYSVALDNLGRPKRDVDGLELMICHRGTNHTECAHKQIVTTFGTWQAGIQASDALLAEWRHRHNQGVSERRRIGYPPIGHYDTHLIDSLQALVMKNRNVDIYPGWSNTSAYKPTPESFGTVPLHSPELGMAISNISVSDEAISKLTSDSQYMCRVMATKLPLLPVHGAQERSLYKRLVLEQLRLIGGSGTGTGSGGTSSGAGSGSTAGGGSLDFDRMALDWCRHVDPSKGIFPKLPVYLRMHHTAWQRSCRVADAVRHAEPGHVALRRLLREDAPQMEDVLTGVRLGAGTTGGVGVGIDGRNSSGGAVSAEAAVPPQADRGEILSMHGSNRSEAQMGVADAAISTGRADMSLSADGDGAGFDSMAGGGGGAEIDGAGAGAGMMGTGAVAGSMSTCSASARSVGGGAGSSSSSGEAASCRPATSSTWRRWGKARHLAFASALPLPPGATPLPIAFAMSEAPRFVAGVPIGPYVQPAVEPLPTRGQDRQKRKPRSCSGCVAAGMDEETARKCPGTNNRKRCKHTTTIATPTPTPAACCNLM